jgi:hypothetical protein
MTDEQSHDPAVEVVAPGAGPEELSDGDIREAVAQPAKVIRIGAMVRQLLEEVRGATLDEASRTRLREIYESSIAELADVLSPDLKEELGRLSRPFQSASPSEAELRVAHAQLVGWLEGLFHGIQAMLFAQQAQSRAQLEEMRRRSLPRSEGGVNAGQYLGAISATTRRWPTVRLRTTRSRRSRGCRRRARASAA